MWNSHERDAQESGDSLSVCQQPCFNFPDGNPKAHLWGGIRQPSASLLGDTMRRTVQVDKNKPWEVKRCCIEAAQLFQETAFASSAEEPVRFRSDMPNDHLYYGLVQQALRGSRNVNGSSHQRQLGAEETELRRTFGTGMWYDGFVQG